MDIHLQLLCRKTESEFYPEFGTPDTALPAKPRAIQESAFSKSAVYIVYIPDGDAPQGGQDTKGDLEKLSLAANITSESPVKEGFLKRRRL